MNITFDRKLLLGLLAALLLSGCAAFAPPKPYTTEAEALSARGEPTRRWDNGDGTTTLEFSTQPNGDSCLMVEVDASGIVLRQWDALSDQNLARVRPGMTPDEISRLLGEHRSEQSFRLSGETVWDWNIPNYGPGIATLFNVHFIDGKVVRTSQTYIYPRDWGMGSVWMGYPYHFGFGYTYPYPPRYRDGPPPRRRGPPVWLPPHPMWW
nr:hypothetical protein [Parazoarcus communis]